MRKYHRAKCGLYFDENCYGDCWTNGYEFSDNTGVYLAHCPYKDKCDCQANKEFREKLPNYKWADCEVVACDEYDYNNSAEKIFDEYANARNDKITRKFGGYCPCIEFEPYGEYSVKYETDRCAHCWNEECLITKKKRDITKVYLMGDLESLIVDDVGFFHNETKRIVRRKLYKNAIPKEVAERIIKKPEESIFVMMFKTNNVDTVKQELGFEPRAKLRRLYYEPVRAKRDLLQDLRDIEEGYEVIHESDQIAKEKRAKSERLAKRREEKEKKLKRALSGIKPLIPEQIGFDIKEED